MNIRELNLPWHIDVTTNAPTVIRDCRREIVGAVDRNTFAQAIVAAMNGLCRVIELFD